MYLKYYAEIIKNLAESYPDLKVVYSSDDEGNEFSLVHYQPALVTDIETRSGTEIKEAICVN